MCVQVQTSAEATASKIQNLKQEFNQLKARMDSGEAVTPGVKKTIKKLIDMVSLAPSPHAPVHRTCSHLAELVSSQHDASAL